MSKPVATKLSTKLAEQNSQDLFARLWQVALTKAIDIVATEVADRLARELKDKVLAEPDNASNQS